MPLTIQTDSGSEVRANSYVDVEYSDDYFTEIGFVDWDDFDVEIKDGIEIDGIPENLKMAICEYAKRAISNSLNPDPDYSNNGLHIKSFREKVGPIDEMTVYQDSTNEVSKVRKYPEADSLVSHFKKPKGFFLRG